MDFSRTLGQKRESGKIPTYIWRRNMTDVALLISRLINYLIRCCQNIYLCGVTNQIQKSITDDVKLKLKKFGDQIGKIYL